MNIVVTGGFGFIGSNAVIALNKKGHQITVITRNNIIPAQLKHLEKAIKIIVGTYNDEKILKKVLPKTDIIIHTACTTVPENSTNNPLYDIETNVLPSIKLIQEAVSNKVKKIIFISSGGVIYGKNEELVISEDHSTNPISSYGITKLSIEKYLNLYNHLYGLDFVSLRIANAYGPFQNYKYNQGVINNWLGKIRNGENLEVWGDGSVIRDYIYIDDVIDAIELCVLKDIKGIYNIGSGAGISLKNLGNLIITLTGSNQKIVYRDLMRKFDVKKNVLDSSKFKDKSAWEPRVTLKEGIIKFYNSIK